MRALAIDDDPTIADMVTLALTIEGFDVTVAHSGEDGLLATLNDQPHVIVLDVMMPKVDGWQIATKLRKHPELADVPIVFCTALGDDESMWQGWQSGAASYVTKPFDPSHLVAEVVRTAHGRCPVRRRSPLVGHPRFDRAVPDSGAHQAGRDRSVGPYWTA